MKTLTRTEYPLRKTAHSRHNGIAELIEEGKTAGNHIKLSYKIRYLYENAEVGLKLGPRGYARVVGRLTEER